MSKQSMDWHRQCLHNQALHLDRRRADVERQLAELQKAERNFEFYRRQIAEAEKRGMDAFDSDRLLVKRSA